MSIRMNGTVVAPAIFVLAISATLPATAATLATIDLGEARNYAFIATGDSVKMNSGPIAGDALIGNNVDVDFSGGNDGGIAGTLFYDQSIVDNDGVDEFGDLENPGASMRVDNADVDTAVSDAEAAAAAASALGAGITFTGQNIVGIGGLNVFSADDLDNPEFTITGTSDDFFVFNIAGTFKTNEAMTLNGVDASQILWNFTAEDAKVLQTSGGNELFGTFLATGEGAEFKGSNLNITGALINTAGDVDFVSGSSIPVFMPIAPPAPTPTFTPIAAPAPVPLPAGLTLLISAFGLTALIHGMRRRS